MVRKLLASSDHPQPIRAFRLISAKIQFAPTKDKKAPAMRLGLAKGPVKYEDILYFTGP